MITFYCILWSSQMLEAQPKHHLPCSTTPPWGIPTHRSKIINLVHVQWTNASKTLTQVGRTGAYLGQCGTKYQRETFVHVCQIRITMASCVILDYKWHCLSFQMTMASFVIPDYNGILCHPRFTMALFCCIV